MIFKLGDGERVVSVAHLPEGPDENGNGDNGEPEADQQNNEG